MGVDLSPFRRDLDELVGDFANAGAVGFAEFKLMWSSKKFTYIFERRPKTNTAVFMQGLFAHCISHMVSDGSLSRKLGGLYCLYCLYKLQPYRPFFKIYLSLGELKKLKNVVVDAKQSSIGVVAALVKKMLEANMLLFGFVDLEVGSVAQRVEEISRLHDKRVQFAYEKLLANTRIEDYLHMNLGIELDLKGLKKLSTEYARAKDLAVEEASRTVDVEDIKHTTDSKAPLVGDRVQEIVEEWNAQKETFYRVTGITRHNEIVPVEEFHHELENLLTEG